MSLAISDRLGRLAGSPEARTAATAFLATAITMAGGFVFWLISASFFDASSVGSAAAVIAGSSLVAVFAKLGLDTYLPRLVSSTGATPSARSRILRSLWLTTFLSGVGGLVLWIFFWSSNAFPSAGSWVTLVVMIGTAAGMSLLAVTDPLLISLGRVHVLLVRSSVLAILRLAFIPLFAGRPDGLLLAWLASVALAALPSPLLVGRALESHPESLPAISWSWGFLGANYIASILSAVPGLGMPMILAQLVEANVVAYYYIAWNISLLIQTIPQSLSAWLMSHSRTRDELRLASRRFVVASVGLVLPVLIGIFAIGPLLLGAIGIEYRREATVPLLILSCAAVPAIWLALHTTMLRVESRRGPLLMSNVVLASTALIAASLLIPRLGPTGAAAAWLGATILATLLTWWLASREGLTRAFA